MAIKNIAKDVGAVSIGDWISCGDAVETNGIRSIQAGIVGSGVISATVRISGCNDGRFPQTAVEFTLSGANVASDAAELTFPWEFYRMEVTAIAGTGTLATAVLRV